MPTLQVYFLTLCSLKRSYYNRSIVSKPYLKQIVNGSTPNFADLWLAHVHFHPSTTLHMDKISHVTSDTRPSRFSVCNIEKLGMSLGTRLLTLTLTHSHINYIVTLTHTHKLIHTMTQENRMGFHNFAYLLYGTNSW